jgi:hypothetical protein
MTQTRINLSQKQFEIISWFFGYLFFTVCFKICSDLNDYILRGRIFVSLFRWILPSRLLSGRLTAVLKGGWPGARVGKIEASLPYHMNNANTIDEKVVKYTKRKLMISATTLPNLKKM